MHKRLSLTTLTSSLLVTGAASAADDAKGFDLGARLGYGIPFGDLNESVPMDENVSGHVPIWFDLGYRLSPKLLAGLYAQYGVGVLAGEAESACTAFQEEAAAQSASAACGVGVHRFGFQVNYRIKPERTHNPWIGLGVGSEWMPVTFTLERGTETAAMTVTPSGIEFNLQFGWDFDLGPAIRLGPFIALSTSTYDEVETLCRGASDCPPSSTDDIYAPSSHQWLWIGVRAAAAP